MQKVIVATDTNVNPFWHISRYQQYLAHGLNFLRARLARKGMFGLYFTMGTALVLMSMWLFGGISEDLLTDDPLLNVDEVISQWLRFHSDPRLVWLAQIISACASITMVSVLGVVMSGILTRQRDWYALSGLVLAVSGGVFINALLKSLFERTRPGWADPLLALSDPGFPSGHTMMATIIYGYLAWYFLPRVKSRLWRNFLASTLLLLVCLIGFSRLYLGAHYLSDVLAAMAAGVSWLVICLTAMETLRRYRYRTAASINLS